ncbi:Uncharacterized protein TCM_028956 [Theobroma cacao]|uniref:Uncharacterized protein n=1 Tax=Theobroma cacao TaxID=3641 RepID=A0A061GAS8_THECC|nr:Uncharacterized protein TCM_028956 [Theobroma cacao]
MVAIKAYIVLCERIDEIETVQWKLSEMINTLSDETKDALSTLQGDRGKKAKMLKPKRYEWVRDAKELENFLFDIEQYFRALQTELNEDKVAMAAMYLERDAKIWSEALDEDGVTVTKVQDVTSAMLANPQVREVNRDCLLRTHHNPEQLSHGALNLKLQYLVFTAMNLIGAFDNFITPRKAKRYGLKVEKNFRQMEAINSPTLAIMGNSKDVKVKIGS